VADSLSPKGKIPQWAWYAGGGVALGGAYLLYKRKKAASSVATAPTMTQPSTNVDTSAQQPSIAPYYLTAGQGSGYGNNTLTGGAPPLPTPQGSTGISNTNDGVTIPPIPPLLPSNPIPDVSGPAPAPTQPAPIAPTPAAPPPNNNIPADLMAKIQANGERILGGIPSPNGGMWWLGSKGGVFAINAPFYGAPAGQSYWGSRTPAAILPSGNGYRVIDTAGEVYNYGS
jgi:hypothetical protein